MANDLYLDDSYLKEFESTIESVTDNKFVVLNTTAFYPNSGGQPFDTGSLKTETDNFKVIFCGKFNGKISHEVDKPGLKVGDTVKGVIDWDRRYKLMRSHTAAHIISAVIHQNTSAMITGNQLDIDKSRIDFSLEDYDPEKMQDYIDQANDIVKQNLEISVKYIPYKEALQNPNLSKLAKGLPSNLKEIRIVSIGDFDIQADGGTHVKSTIEVGQLTLQKTINKGKDNRRLYFTLED